MFKLIEPFISFIGKNYWVWIPLITIWYCVNAYVSKKNADTQLPFWFWITFLTALCPMWAIVSRYTTNIAFDALLYDILVVFIYSSALMFLGAGQAFKAHNWIGFIIVLIGFIMMRWDK